MQCYLVKHPLPLPNVRLFSNLGRTEVDQRQSVLSGASEMTEVIRAYGKNELQSLSLPKTAVLHPSAVSLRDAVSKVVMDI